MFFSYTLSGLFNRTVTLLKVEVDGSDEKTCADGDSEELDLVLLPERMVSDLRVKLDVWEEEAEAKGQNHA